MSVDDDDNLLLLAVVVVVVVVVVLAAVWCSALLAPGVGVVWNAAAAVIFGSQGGKNKNPMKS